MAARDSEEDLRSLVAELDATLSALRSELDEVDSSSGTDGSGDRHRTDEADTSPARPYRRTRSTRSSRSPRPPSLSELLRFTEQYTLPTLIATLEAAIQSLELLRGALRLADPEGSAFGNAGGETRSSTSRLGNSVVDVGRGAVTGVDRALSELQAALAESDLPEDEHSRTLLEDARQLSDEISERLAEASGERDVERYGYRRPGRASASESDSVEQDASARSAGVEIDVRDARDSDAAAAGTDRGDAEDDGSTTVDVEAELASIKDEVGGAGEPDDDESGDHDDEPVSRDNGTENRDDETEKHNDENTENPDDDTGNPDDTSDTVS